jgi:hypothetical protein
MGICQNRMHPAAREEGCELLESQADSHPIQKSIEGNLGQ